MTKRLIVTADDFGATVAINEAVERAHRGGVLTSASLMVAEPAAYDAVERSRRMPALAVGLHVALTNARPMLAPERVPDLVDRDGRFDGRLVRAGVRFFALPRVRAQVRAEIRAQFEAFAATGLALDHVDGHNHLHVHPTILSAILEIGRGFGMRAVRVPFEPFRPSAQGVANALVIGPWAALMRARLRRAGIGCNDAVFGLHDTGRLDEARVLAVIARLREGLSELYCHPRHRIASVASPALAEEYAREEELDALVSPRVREAIARAGVTLARYGDGA
jgi:chitin disaccharide deacetylase